MPRDPAPEIQQALAPGGRLRVGVYLGGPSSAVRDARTGELSGIAHDLGKELAQRLAVRFEPVIFKRSAEIIDALKAGRIDVSFITFSSARARDIDYSKPYLQIENSFLVAADSGATTQADLDVPGNRVAALGGGTSDTILTRELKNAAVLRASGIGQGIEWLRGGEVQAFGAQKTILFEMSRQLPGSRVLDGYFTAERHAVALPKGRDAGKAYIEAFAADVRSNGFVRALIAQAGLQGVRVVGD